jgi:hypothetical protein
METIIRGSSVFQRHNAAVQLCKKNMSEMLAKKQEPDSIRHRALDTKTPAS